MVRSEISCQRRTRCWRLDDGHQAVDAHLEVVATAGEVVDDADLMAPSGQVQRRRPTEVAVTTEDQNVHVVSSSRSGTVPLNPGQSPSTAQT